MAKNCSRPKRAEPTPSKRRKDKVAKASRGLDAAADGDLARLSLNQVERHLHKSKSAQAFIQTLELVGAQRVKPLRQQIHRARREQLAEAYAAISAFGRLDRSMRSGVTEELKLRDASARSSGDPIHLILRSVFEYAGYKADRSILCRDAQAIKYALEQKIKASEFVERLSAKGASIRRWADAYATSHRSLSSDMRRRDVEQSVERTQAQKADEEILTLPIDRECFKRSGFYLAIIALGKERVPVVRRTEFLAKSLKNKVIDQVISASKNAAPITEQG